MDQECVVSGRISPSPAGIKKIYKFRGAEMVETDEANVGDIVAVAGMDNITIGETLTDPLNPVPLDGIEVDPPTVSMNFVSKRFTVLRERRPVCYFAPSAGRKLFRETLSDVALIVEELGGVQGWNRTR